MTHDMTHDQLAELHARAGARLVEVAGRQVPEVYSSVEAEYRVAHAGAVVYDAVARGRLRMTGSTHIDFLQRMSTNDLHGLQAGQGAATILTTPIGRIVDRIIVYVRDGDAIVLTSPGAQDAVAGWLRKYIFYNDDVQIHDASAEYGIVSIYGPAAAEVATRLAGRGASGLKLHAWQAGPDQILIARADAVAGSGFHVLAPSWVSMAALWKLVLEAGAAPIGERALEVLRVESGAPLYGRELSEAYIPLEVGLWPDVSFSKGCYIGQEIIARMESRQRLAKQLVGLRSRLPLEVGAALYADGEAVGKVSSATPRPGGDQIGLGFVKPAHAAPGGRLARQVDVTDGVEVMSLPIPAADRNPV